jgi:thiol-disulfide isomerase/thioredoxin
MARFLVLAAAVLAAGCGRKPHHSAFGWGNSPALPITGKDSEGNTFRLSDFEGKVVALDFWATWCGPCRKVIPHERQLVAEMQGRPFVLVGVSADQSATILREFEKKEQITWRSWVDGPGGPIQQAWRVEALPTIFLIDHEGIIRYKFEGAVPPEVLDPAIMELVAKAEGKR